MAKTMRELQKYIELGTYARRRQIGPNLEVGITESFGPDAAPETVDVHFLDIGFMSLAGDWSAQELYDALIENQVGEFSEMGLERWAGGPSYIEIGGWIGSQDLALRLLGLGEYHKLWDVITPAKMHITGKEADELAGLGMVMASGIKNPAEVPA